MPIYLPWKKKSITVPNVEIMLMTLTHLSSYRIARSSWNDNSNSNEMFDFDDAEVNDLRHAIRLCNYRRHEWTIRPNYTLIKS